MVPSVVSATNNIVCHEPATNRHLRRARPYRLAQDSPPLRRAEPPSKQVAGADSGGRSRGFYGAADGAEQQLSRGCGSQMCPCLSAASLATLREE